MKRIALVLFFALPLSADGFPAWMSGSWGETIDGVRMEEQWTGAEGNLMLGIHRDVRPSGKAQFEFIRIEKRDGVLAYVAQPGGRPPTVFLFESAGKSRITFENLAHDFPQRIEYWLENGKLCARVSGKIGEETESEQWCWSRIR